MRALILGLGLQVVACEPTVNFDHAVEVALVNRNVWLIPVRSSELDLSQVLEGPDLARLCMRQRDNASCNRFAGCEMTPTGCDRDGNPRNLGCDSIWVCAPKR